MSGIVVVGDVMVDVDCFYETDRITNDGTRVVKLIKREARLGGAGAAFQMIKALYGGPLHLVEIPKPRCIKTRRIIDGKVAVREDQDHKQDITRDQAIVAVREIKSYEPEVILVSDYSKGSITEVFWEYLGYYRQVNHPKIIVDPGASRPLDFYRGAWAILPNQHEAGFDKIPEVDDGSADYADMRQGLIEAATKLVFKLTQFYPNTCIKLGSLGMVHTDGEWEILHTPAHKINLVDHCGAGDMVAACIAVATLEGENFGTACKWANKMAGYKCQQWGATPIYGDPDVTIRAKDVAQWPKEGAGQATSLPSPSEQRDQQAVTDTSAR